MSTALFTVMTVFALVCAIGAFVFAGAARKEREECEQQREAVAAEAGMLKRERAELAALRQEVVAFETRLRKVAGRIYAVTPAEAGKRGDAHDGETDPELQAMLELQGAPPARS